MIQSMQTNKSKINKYEIEKNVSKRKYFKVNQRIKIYSQNFLQNIENMKS